MSIAAGKDREQLESFLSGTMTQVDVTGIERQLRQLWYNAAGSERGDGTPDVVRACAYNFILCSQDDDAETVGNDLLADLAAYHPFRALLVVNRQGRDGRLEAWVSTRCHRVNAQKQICTEQITVVADGHADGPVLSVVEPLMVTDLPVFLWWRQRQLTSGLLQKLAQCSSKVIVDTGLASHEFDTAYLADVAKMFGQLPARVVLSDLNWRRLHSWQIALANAFDGFPLMPQDLHGVKTVNIKSQTGTASGAVSCSGLLLCAWMASRLDWKVSAAKLAAGEIWFAKPEPAGGGEVVVTFSKGEAAGAKVPAGTPIMLEASFACAANLEIAARFGQGGGHLVTRLVGTDGPTELEPFEPAPAETTLVANLVESMATDQLYWQTMAVVKDIVGQK